MEKEESDWWVLMPVLIVSLTGLIIMLALLCMPWRSQQKKQPQPAKQTQERDTVVTFPPDTLVYPSGATGSLRFDWETGEKGKLIEK